MDDHHPNKKQRTNNNAPENNNNNNGNNLSHQQQEPNQTSSFAENTKTQLQGLVSDHECLQQIWDNKWSSQLNEILDSCKQTKTLVCFLGDTGIGKSYLINALLREDVLPHSDDSASCTSAVIEVHYNRDLKYSIEVEFFSEDEWQDLLSQMRTYLEPQDPDATPLDDLKNTETKETMKTYAKAFFGSTKIPAEEPQYIKDCIKQGRRTEVYFSGKQLQRNLAQFGTAMRKHFVEDSNNNAEVLDDSSSSSSSDSEEDSMVTDDNAVPESRPLWPLIKVIRVTGPFSILRNGLVLVDLPGTSDTNVVKAKMAEKYFRKCDFVFYTVGIGRTNQLHFKNLVSQTLSLAMDRENFPIGAVITKADTVKNPPSHKKDIKKMLKKVMKQNFTATSSPNLDQSQIQSKTPSDIKLFVVSAKYALEGKPAFDFDLLQQFLEERSSSQHLSEGHKNLLQYLQDTILVDVSQLTRSVSQQAIQAITKASQKEHAKGSLKDIPAVANCLAKITEFCKKAIQTLISDKPLKKYLKSVHHQTAKAIYNRNGIYVADQFDAIRVLISLVITDLLPIWRRVFSLHFLGLGGQFRLIAKKLGDAFFREIQAVIEEHQLGNDYSQQIHNHLEISLKYVDRDMCAVIKKARKKWRDAKKLLQEQMAPAFHDAKAISGKGSSAAKYKHVQKYASVHASDLFTAADKLLQSVVLSTAEELDKLLLTVPDRSRSIIDKIVSVFAQKQMVPAQITQADLAARKLIDQLTKEYKRARKHDIIIFNSVNVCDFLYDSQAKEKQQLGRGSAGTVYRGSIPTTQTSVAIKQFQTYAELIREAEILRKLDHVNIMSLIGVDLDNFRLILPEMTCDLRSQIRNVDPMQTKDIAIQIAQGLEYLHSMKKCHRDLKPENILLQKQGPTFVVKIADMGIARDYLIDEYRNHTNSAEGTPLYMAPETFRKQSQDESVDIWSFGVILWEMVTKEIPYVKEKVQDAILKGVLPGEIPDIWCKGIIQQCWQQDPKKRPPASDLVHMLQVEPENDIAIIKRWVQSLVGVSKTIYQIGRRNKMLRLSGRVEAMLEHLEQDILQVWTKEQIRLIKEGLTSGTFGRNVALAQFQHPGMNEHTNNCIYFWRNKIDLKGYVGKTNNQRKIRDRSHKYSTKTPFDRALHEKHEDWEVVTVCQYTSHEQCERLECLHVVVFNTSMQRSEPMGYNKEFGGPWKHSKMDEELIDADVLYEEEDRKHSEAPQSQS